MSIRVRDIPWWNINPSAYMDKEEALNILIKNIFSQQNLFL